MGADQISEIAPEIREVISGGGNWCATLEVSGDPTRWVQFTLDAINAAYPYDIAPNDKFGDLDDFVVMAWEPNTFATFKVAGDDPRKIAKWIDRYFSEVLACKQDYTIDATLEDLGS